MENKAHALLAGLFTLCLLIAAGFGVYWFNADRVHRIPYEIATTLSVPGLNAQADVRYRGIDAGKVSHIRFDPTTPGQILIRILVNPDTPMTHSTYGTLGYQGVTGIAYVQLDDDGTHPEKLPSTAEKPARITLRASLFDTLQTKGLTILDEAEDMVKRFNTLLGPANQTTMLAAFSDVSQAAHEFETIPRQMQPTLEKLPEITTELHGSLASITKLSHQLTDLSQKLSTLTQTLQAPGGPVAEFTQTTKNLGDLTNRVEFETLPHITTLTTDAQTTLRTLNHTMETFTQKPQSLLFGTKQTPGPGEPGFSSP